MKFKVGDLVKYVGEEPMDFPNPSYVTHVLEGPNPILQINHGIGGFSASLFELVQKAPQKLLNAVDILEQGKGILNQRGQEYEASEGTGERSFNSVATAFNAITGKDLTPAEVCLVLQIVKDVRQWSQDRLHPDSIVDCVNYAALKGEELYKQYTE